MNKIQTKHLRMFINTQEALDENTNLWSGIPIVVNVKNNLDELIQRIEEQNEKTNPGSQAITTNKNKTLQNLIEKVMALAGTMQAFAAFNDDTILAGKVKLTKSAIIQARETDVEAMLKPIITAARENLSGLADFMVTEEMVTEVETSLDNFKTLIGQPRNIRNQAFAAMSLLDELFETTNNLIKNKLDKLMFRFEFTNTEFYSAYKRARVIVD